MPAMREQSVKRASPYARADARRSLRRSSSARNSIVDWISSFFSSPSEDVEPVGAQIVGEEERRGAESFPAPAASTPAPTGARATIGTRLSSQHTTPTTTTRRNSQRTGITAERTTPAGTRRNSQRATPTIAASQRRTSTTTSQDGTTNTTTSQDQTSQDQTSLDLPQESSTPPDRSFNTNSLAKSPNEILRKFFIEKGNDPLTEVEYQGVLSLIRQAAARNESVIDVSQNRSFQSNSFRGMAPRDLHYDFETPENSQLSVSLNRNSFNLFQTDEYDQSGFSNQTSEADLSNILRGAGKRRVSFPKKPCKTYKSSPTSPFVPRTSYKSSEGTRRSLRVATRKSLEPPEVTERSKSEPEAENKGNNSTSLLRPAGKRSFKEAQMEMEREAKEAKEEEARKKETPSQGDQKETPSQGDQGSHEIDIEPESETDSSSEPKLQQWQPGSKTELSSTASALLDLLDAESATSTVERPVVKRPPAPEGGDARLVVKKHRPTHSSGLRQELGERGSVRAISLKTLRTARPMPTFDTSGGADTGALLKEGEEKSEEKETVPSMLSFKTGFGKDLDTKTGKQRDTETRKETVHEQGAQSARERREKATENLPEQPAGHLKPRTSIPSFKSSVPFLFPTEERPKTKNAEQPTYNVSLRYAWDKKVPQSNPVLEKEAESHPAPESESTPGVTDRAETPANTSFGVFDSLLPTSESTPPQTAPARTAQIQTTQAQTIQARQSTPQPNESAFEQLIKQESPKGAPFVELNQEEEALVKNLLDFAGGAIFASTLE